MFGELKEELFDFVEDVFEIFIHKHSHKNKNLRTVLLNGIVVSVRPAQIFAERIEGLLRMVMGISVLISAFLATSRGFLGLSDFIDFLVTSLFGRAVLFIVGVSYLILGIWKLGHIKVRSTSTHKNGPHDYDG
jgi:hypothetical protein